MSTMILSEDPADLFCQLFDQMSDLALAHDRAWRRNAHLEALTAEVRGFALALELHSPWAGRRMREVARRVGEQDAARWAVARGLDQALSTCHPLLRAPTGATDASELEHRILARYTSTGRLDTGAIPGALVPK